jgi:single-strand DNA-binding protein
MLGGKGEGGGKGRAPEEPSYESPSYEEPSFNPDDDIPF